jgi:hypothetical protein
MEVDGRRGLWNNLLRCQPLDIQFLIYNSISTFYVQPLRPWEAQGKRMQ